MTVCRIWKAQTNTLNNMRSLITGRSLNPPETAIPIRLCLIGLKILTMCVSWKFSVKSTMIGRSATKAKSIKSLLCPNAHPPSKNVPLKRHFQDISPSLTETALSLIFCLSILSKFKWVLTVNKILLLSINFK